MPNEFWTEGLEKKMRQAVSNYKKFENKINKQVYLDDMLKTLVTFGIRSTGSKAFIKEMEEFFRSQLRELDAKMCENLLFFLTSEQTEDIQFLHQVLTYVEQRGFVQKG